LAKENSNEQEVFTAMILCPQLQPVNDEYDNDWFSVKNRGGYYTFEPKGEQVAVLVTMEDSVLLVKVHRPVINDNTWELPAGGCAINESPVDGACRELHEETGILVAKERLKPITSMSICPNRYVSNPHIFSVEITAEEFNTRSMHDDEILAVQLFSFIEIKEMLLTNQIYVALPALTLAKLLLERVV
jgi:ADP-ribose pyrophosphatase